MSATSGRASSPGTEPSYGVRTLGDGGRPDTEQPFFGGLLPVGAGVPKGGTSSFGGRSSYDEELSGGAAGGDGTGDG